MGHHCLVHVQPGDLFEGIEPGMYSIHTPSLDSSKPLAPVPTLSEVCRYCSPIIWISPHFNWRDSCAAVSDVSFILQVLLYLVWGGEYLPCQLRKSAENECNLTVHPRHRVHRLARIRPPRQLVFAFGSLFAVRRACWAEFGELALSQSHQRLAKAHPWTTGSFRI